MKGVDRYPVTVEGARNLLQNYEVAPRRVAVPRLQHDVGVAMAQRRIPGGRGPGRGRGAGGRGTEGGRGGGAGTEGATAAPEGQETPNRRVNSAGEHRCFNCGANDHWALECPFITDEQSAQLHMMQELDLEDCEEASMHYQKVLFQAKDDDVVYLDTCTTSSTFVGEHNLTDVQDMRKGIAVQCNAGKVKNNRRGDFGSLKA